MYSWGFVVADLRVSEVLGGWLKGDDHLVGGLKNLFFKSLLNVSMLLLFHVLVFWLEALWDLSSLTRYQTRPHSHWKAKY